MNRNILLIILLISTENKKVAVSEIFKAQTYKYFNK